MSDIANQIAIVNANNTQYIIPIREYTILNLAGQHEHADAVSTVTKAIYVGSKLSNELINSQDDDYRPHQRHRRCSTFSLDDRELDVDCIPTSVSRLSDIAQAFQDELEEEAQLTRSVSTESFSEYKHVYGKPFLDEASYVQRSGETLTIQSVEAQVEAYVAALTKKDFFYSEIFKQDSAEDERLKISPQIQKVFQVIDDIPIEGLLPTVSLGTPSNLAQPKPSRTMTMLWMTYIATPLKWLFARKPSVRSPQEKKIEEQKVAIALLKENMGCVLKTNKELVLECAKLKAECSTKAMYANKIIEYENELFNYQEAVHNGEAMIDKLQMNLCASDELIEILKAKVVKSDQTIQALNAKTADCEENLLRLLASTAELQAKYTSSTAIQRAERSPSTAKC